VGFVERYYYRGAGRSAMRRYNDLARNWRRRTFGVRTGYYVASLLFLGSVACVLFTPARFRFLEGLFFGALGAAVFLLPQALLPDQIARWERGAWGEQSTSRRLRRLDRKTWQSRHDLATGYGKTNRDHIVVGPAVFLLNSKLIRDEVTVEEDGLRIRNFDTNAESPLRPTKAMSAAAKALARDIESAVGFPVHVYPIVVIWSSFPAGEYWEGDVAYVDGERIADWIARRPHDVLQSEKRTALKSWLKAQPAAKG
jgi:hypothetical protein